MAHTNQPRGGSAGRTMVVAVLFIAQFVALLAVGTYASQAPTLFGFPFFYWYTLLWLVIGAISMGVALALTRGPSEGSSE
ncbi:MAG: DUF3311 domain-containing protein [Mycobacteriales bacterium]